MYLEKKQYGLLSYYFPFLLALFYPVKIKWYILLSNCKRFLIFPPRFPDIPRKISEYLQSDFPSDANTRNIRGYYNILNINVLYLRGVFSHCKKHHFGLRNGLYCSPKSTMSHPEMGFIVLRNGQYRKAERNFPDYVMGYIKIWYYTKYPLLCYF